MRYLLHSKIGKPSVTPAVWYSTNFALTENPLSEGGAWADGGIVAPNANNIQTNGSFAYSAVDAFNFNDCAALLTNPLWLLYPHQHCRAKVRSINQQPAKFQEVEFRFRQSAFASGQTSVGYELYFKCASDGSQYINVTRFDAGTGICFTSNLSNLVNGYSGGIVDGSIIDGYMKGNIITAYVNDVLLLTFDVSTGFGLAGNSVYVNGVNTGSPSGPGAIWTAGYPGIGMDEGASGGSTLTDWGLYNFYAESL